MESLTMEILKLIIIVIGIILTYFVVPWIKAKTDNEKLVKIGKQFDNTFDLIADAVAAAERRFDLPKSGIQKKAYVIKFLKEKGIEVTELELDIIIDAILFEMDKVKKELFEDEEIEPG